MDIYVLREIITNTMQTREAEYLVSYLEIYRSLSLCLLQTDIKQNRGLPQSASNSSKFFNFYINDILENINNTDMNVSLNAFADDMLIQAGDLPALQEVFRKTCSLLKVQLGLEVNVSKTELVSNNTDDYITDESGEVIMATDHGKYLGQLIDADGNTMTTINNSFFCKII